jgi:hypothetical protein
VALGEKWREKVKVVWRKRSGEAVRAGGYNGGSGNV